MTDWNQLKAALGNGRMDRRRFMQQASALGISTTMAGSFATSAGYAETPKPGGRLRVGLAHGSTSDSLDPGAVGVNGFLGVYNYAHHNHLGDIGESGTLEPELAQSWEGTDGATVWTFELRQDVVFHNGKTMDADDVVASINYHRDKDSGSAGMPLLADVEDVQADGPHVVTFRLKSGNADFPYTITDQHFMILPSEEGHLDWQNGAASGPYILEEFNPGVQAFMTKNPNYFKEGRPYFDELEILSIPDAVARGSALQSGSVDLIDRVELKTAHLLANEDGIRVEETQGMLHFTLPMLSDVSPFDSNDVRLAIKYAIDRERLVETVLSGHGTVGNDHPISEINPYHASDLEQRQYDPDKAKFHLKQAGYDRLTVPLHVADAAFAGAVDTAVLYREYAAEAGIDIEIVREANDGYWSNVWLQKPWCASYWLGRVSAFDTFQLVYASGIDWNEGHFEHERFNTLLTSVRGEVDEERRREMFHDMQSILRDEGGSVIPMFGNYVFASSTALQHGPTMRGDRDLDGQKFSERWWFS